MAADMAARRTCCIESGGQSDGGEGDESQVESPCWFEFGGRVGRFLLCGVLSRQDRLYALRWNSGESPFGYLDDVFFTQIIAGER